MKFIQQLRERAKSRERHVVFSESTDVRILKAASWLMNNDICRVTLLGSKSDITRASDKYQIPIHESALLSQEESKNDKEKYASHFHRTRIEKGMTRNEALGLMDDLLYMAAAKVAWGDADAGVAGSVRTTSDVLRAALQVIGLAQDCDIVSSVFLIVLPDNRVLTYGDCGVVPYPNEEELAEIAIQSSRTHKLLVQEEPYIAMLSFSTKGSADHESVTLVQHALSKVKQRKTGLAIDGEFQFDAAFVPEVANIKAPDSIVAGKANVMIFPNLDAGNIAYKISERLGGASATGPIIQGLAKPMMDLSRGCDWEDIVNSACVAILMSDSE